MAPTRCTATRSASWSYASTLEGIRMSIEQARTSERGEGAARGLAAARPAPTDAIDVAAVEAWLVDHVPGFAGPLTLERFEGGQSNPTYKLVTPRGAYVMRSKPGPASKLLPSAHAIEREFRVMSALAGSGVPVARVHAL